LFRYYYTQFIGDPNDRPTIKGMSNFTGIALIDTDVYIPGGNGNEWYINQNQFYRQVRNFVFDLTSMPETSIDGDQSYAPTGIHWQVAQATSLQNLYFIMKDATQEPTNEVGIFMENVSAHLTSSIAGYCTHRRVVIG
jgi:glucan 1,3-beta-glucosidase